MECRRMALVVLGLTLMLVPAPASDQDSGTLPKVIVTELKHLEETYRVLDAVSEKIWPGWKDYRQVPFLLEYDNGLKVLIGHPNPPKEFQAVPGFRVGDSLVFADRTALNAKELVGPLTAGGGLIGFGSTTDGRSVEVVRMKFTPARQSEPGESAERSTEEQIIIYIHELFHCFQRAHIKTRMYGNLRFNADAEYALWSEIEGLALHRAYSESDAEKARLLVKEFLAARALKRASMSELQGNEESSDEFREGTATYSEVRTLETIQSAGFRPGLTAEQDPDYHGFRNADALLRKYPERLLKTAADVEYPYGKSYTYGCFQALLSERLFPGWQDSVTGGSGFIDRELAKQLPLTPEEKTQIEQKLRTSYPVAEIRERNARYLDARDDAYRKMNRRTGRIYVVDFKATGQFLSSIASKKGSYKLGNIQLYPDGLGPLKFDEVELSAVTGPAEINQLYFVRAIDSAKRDKSKPFTIDGVKQADGSWKGAVVRTPLFTLKAPHVRVKTSGNLVKFQVLARVK